MSSVVLRKNGGFYSAYGDDAFILYYLFSYKIIDDKVGFPIVSYNKIVNVLENSKINYIVNDKKINVNFKRKNNYYKFVNLGKNKHNLECRINNIISKLNNLTEDDLDEILILIEEKI